MTKRNPTFVMRGSEFRQNTLAGQRINATWRRLGIDVRYTNNSPMELYDHAHRTQQDEICFCWAADIRREHDGKIEPHPKVVYVEYGYGLCHYDCLSFDPRGHGALTTLPNTRPKYSFHDDQALDQWLTNYYWPEQPHPERDPLEDLPTEPFIALFLNQPRDTTTYDAPGWVGDGLPVAEALNAAIPHSAAMAVKFHPSDSRNSIPRSRNAQFNANAMSRCGAVAVVNSSMWAEAAVRDVPVISLGKGVFTGNNVTHEWEPGFPLPALHRPGIAGRALLQELCLCHQIHAADFSDVAVVTRVLRNLSQRYEAIHGYPLHPVLL